MGMGETTVPLDSPHVRSEILEVTQIPRPTLLAMSYTAIAHGVAAVVILGPATRPTLHYSELDFLWIFLGVSIGLAACEHLLRSRRWTRFALTGHCGVILLIQMFLPDLPVVEVLLALCLVMSITLYERFPGNEIWALSFSVLAIANRIRLVAGQGGADPGLLIAHAGPGLALCVVAVALSRMTRYREELISLQHGYSRLDQTIGQLSRLNQEYQDTLVRVESESTENERRRITRDIHDIVGYTLTNNIMLMEAATDMARINPLGVTRMLNAARENAQEGLKRVRQTLYALRERHEAAPQGPSAISKLVSTFQTATGITVATSFTNVPMQLPSMVDFTTYHIVQEGLINAFRHGNASRIEVILTVVDDSLRVVLTDNGVGAKGVKAGIGLQGMQERVGRLGGDVRWSAGNHGFTIAATIPLRRRDDGSEDTSAVDR